MSDKKAEYTKHSTQNIIKRLQKGKGRKRNKQTKKNKIEEIKY